MKAQDERPNLPEMPPYRLGRHWNTIQAYLIPGIEDDIGELSEEMKKFMGICELLIDDKMFAKYRWCGNGRPPTIQRLCGWESVDGDIPLCAFLSSASMHNSQAMIPMMQRASAKFVNIIPAEAVRYRAVCRLEHPRIQIYMIYMFHTTLKEGFATDSMVNCV